MKRDFSIPSLDGLRGCAFLLVFVAHAGWDHIIPGGLGVTIFFFLSGYLITSLLRIEAAEHGDVSLRRFYIRRIFRIFPPMYVTLALVLLLSWLGVIQGRGNALGVTSAVAYFYNYASLLLPNVHLPAGAGIIWSLMIEEHFYLIFPVLFWLFTRNRVSSKSQANVLLGICAAVLIWRYILVFHFHASLEALPRWTYNSTDARFDAILWGCVLAIRNNPWFGDRPILSEKSKGILAGVGLAVLFGSLLYREPHYRETLRYTVQSLALYPIFYYCVGTSRSWGVRWLEWKPLRWVGWLSYSLYLCHLTIIDTLGQLHPGHIVVNAVAALLIALIFALLMRYLLEEPARKLRNKLEKSYLESRDSDRIRAVDFRPPTLAPSFEEKS